MNNRALNVPTSYQRAGDEIEIWDQSGEPFTAVWNWLLDRTDLTGMEKLVWIALKSYAGCREIRPSVKNVARRASVSVRTAQRAIIALTAKALVRVERRSRPDGGFATNRYILLPPVWLHTTLKGSRRRLVTSPPGVIVTPTPGDTLSPPQVSLWHHKEKIKRIKNKGTTPLTPLEPAGGCAVNEPAAKECSQVTEDRAYHEAQAKLSALSQEEREELFSQARARLPDFLRNSRQAVRAKAIEMMLSQARAPDG